MLENLQPIQTERTCKVRTIKQGLKDSGEENDFNVFCNAPLSGLRKGLVAFSTPKFDGTVGRLLARKDFISNTRSRNAALSGSTDRANAAFAAVYS